jgi:regulator of RNase E activity RraA
VTCRSGPDDNLAIFAALDVVRPGDAIVAATDAFTTSAVAGDLLLGMARNCGAVAFVTDGLVRDAAGVRSVGLATFSRGVTPNSCVRNGPGTVGLPVSLGGVAVHPGDIVVGDADGVVVVPLGDAAWVVARLAEVRAAEAALEARVGDGLKVPDWVRAVLDSERTQSIE